MSLRPRTAAFLPFGTLRLSGDGRVGQRTRFFPDRGHETLVASGDLVRAIVLLHPDQPYSKGEVSAKFVARLKQFRARSDDSAEVLYFGAFGGFRALDFFGRMHGIGNFGVPSGHLHFVAPEMVVHYIERHGYSPPFKFVAVVLRSPLPDTKAYQMITEPLRHGKREVIKFLVECPSSSRKGREPNEERPFPRLHRMSRVTNNWWAALESMSRSECRLRNDGIFPAPGNRSRPLW